MLDCLDLENVNTTTKIAYQGCIPLMISKVMLNACELTN